MPPKLAATFSSASQAERARRDMRPMRQAAGAPTSVAIVAERADSSRLVTMARCVIRLPSVFDHCARVNPSAVHRL